MEDEFRNVLANVKASDVAVVDKGPPYNSEPKKNADPVRRILTG